MHFDFSLRVITADLRNDHFSALENACKGGEGSGGYPLRKVFVQIFLLKSDFWMKKC